MEAQVRVKLCVRATSSSWRPVGWRKSEGDPTRAVVLSDSREEDVDWLLLVGTIRYGLRLLRLLLLRRYLRL